MLKDIFLVVGGLAAGIFTNETIKQLKKRKEPKSKAPFDIREILKYPENFRVNVEFENDCLVARLYKKDIKEETK